MVRTLVSALDWGLGHTTRIIPIIKQLIESGEEVIIGVSNRQETVIREFFPDIEIIYLPSVAPVYSKGSNQLFSMAIFVPRFVFSIWKEHKSLKKIVKQYNIDKVISDNRYGLHSNAIKSIIICHQLNILLPRSIRFLQAVTNRISCSAINRFDECWVPDNPHEKSLSGKLSLPGKRIKIPIIYKGVLSRFSLIQSESVDEIPELLIIISGPEKQRTVFENSILKALSKIEKPLDYLIIRGLPQTKDCSIPRAINYCSAGKLKTYIQKSKYIICRSGYSSIMDLAYLNRTAILVPTPGQTEQEYLAEYLVSKNQYIIQKQETLDLPNAINLL